MTKQFQVGDAVETLNIWASGDWRCSQLKAWFRGYTFVRFRSPGVIVLLNKDGVETNWSKDDVRHEKSF